MSLIGIENLELINLVILTPFKLYPFTHAIHLRRISLVDNDLDNKFTLKGINFKDRHILYFYLSLK